MDDQVGLDASSLDQYPLPGQCHTGGETVGGKSMVVLIFCNTDHALTPGPKAASNRRFDSSLAAFVTDLTFSMQAIYANSQY